MRRILFLLVLVFLASSLHAADRYAFHIRVSDGRVMLDDATDTHWQWMMLSWYGDDPSIEQSINDSGTAKPGEADFSLLAGSEDHFRLRCLRDECSVAVGDQTIGLKEGELSPDLPLDSRLTLAFATYF